MNFELLLAITDPPTGTRKFLSVLCTKASTLPKREASLIKCTYLVACNPYALLMTCPMLYFLHMMAMSMILLLVNEIKGKCQLVWSSGSKAAGGAKNTEYGVRSCVDH